MSEEPWCLIGKKIDSDEGVPFHYRTVANRVKKTYTYTAYTDPEYQGVTEPPAYTDTYTDIYTDTMLKKTT